ncbi:MAG: hypothetical protein IJO55_10125 [Lachnospiraceae bacterium]|nr:hypothetical protein [Lachnospiraceae bacterium]
MGLEERIAALEEENQRLKKDNQKLMDIISQMKITLNRLISRYVIENQ